MADPSARCPSALECVILSLHIDRRVSPVRWVHVLINLSVPPHLKEPLLLNVDDDYRSSVTKVLFVLKIHCHLVQMTFVLSVKERCPRCVCTQTSGGELRRSSGRSLPSGAGDISRSRLWVTLSASGMAVAPFPLSVPPDCIPPNCTAALVSVRGSSCGCGVHICVSAGLRTHARGPRAGRLGPACEDHICCAVRHCLVFSWKKEKTS